MGNVYAGLFNLNTYIDYKEYSFTALNEQELSAELNSLDIYKLEAVTSTVGGYVELENDYAVGGANVGAMIVSDSGYAVSSVLYNGEDITETVRANAVNGVYTLENITEDIQLTVSFERLEKAVTYKGYLMDGASIGGAITIVGKTDSAQRYEIVASADRGFEAKLKAGEYTVSPMMNYDSLIAAFAKSNAAERTTVVVTIPEGYTVDQIIDTLVGKYGLSSEKELKDAIENYDYDYWFVKRLETDKPRYGRKYRLEGYLYPDTYYYFSDSSASAIIYKMLDNFDKKVKEIFRGDKTVPGNNYIEKIDYLCGNFGLSFDDIVTIASMVQMEGKYTTEFDTISSVFHNRLKNPSVTNGKLESDATLQYLLDKRTEHLTEEHKQIDSPYNTYLYEGLPPGAISNPAQTALIYALYPDDTKYYFFVADKDGHSLFARTYKEHQQNIAKVNAGE